MVSWRPIAGVAFLMLSLLVGPRPSAGAASDVTSQQSAAQPGSLPAPVRLIAPRYEDLLSFLTHSRVAPPSQPSGIAANPAITVPADFPVLATQHPADASTSYATVPHDFPAITVTVPAKGTAGGYVFASPFAWNQSTPISYLLILDNQGQPVYYQRMPKYSNDFTMLSNGTLAYFDQDRSAFIVLDSSYHEIDTIRAGQGYIGDEHELQRLPNGHYLWLVDETRIIDMSKLVPHGNPQAKVTGQVIQELDQNKRVVFEWHALDHLPVTDSDQDLTAASIDYTHCNALEADADGNLLLSSRHLDEITKINRQTGAIMWRMGGKENQFTFAIAPGVSGPAQFYKQHDVRRLPNGHITVFDDHNDHQPQVSRALEYAVDENARAATLVWAYRQRRPTSP